MVAQIKIKEKQHKQENTTMNKIQYKIFINRMRTLLDSYRQQACGFSILLCASSTTRQTGLPDLTDGRSFCTKK